MINIAAVYFYGESFIWKPTFKYTYGLRLKLPISADG
jgi:hypothetical protein